MKTRKRICEVGDMFSFTTCPIEDALCLTEAIRLEKSWTPPMKIEPSTIHKTAGSQPNHMAARIGPTIGPAAAIAEKCCPISSEGFAGT